MHNKYSHYTIRIDKQLFEKFRFIAYSRGRSVNKEFEQYVKRCVAEFVD